MKRTIGSASLAALTLGLAFAADPPKPAQPKDSFDALVKDTIGQLNELGELLSKVTDEKTAKDAKPKLEAVAAKLDVLKVRGDKLGKISADDEKRLEGKHKAELESATKKFLDEANRLGGQPYGKVALDAMKPKKPVEKPKDAPKPVEPPKSK